MTRFWFKLALSLIVSFTVLAIIVRASSGLRENPALDGLGVGCEGQELTPCWYGIVPEVSQAWEVYNNLSPLGFKIQDASVGAMRQMQISADSLPCTTLLDVYGGEVYALTFTECRGLLAGDLLHRWDPPNSLCQYANYTGLLFQDRTILAYLQPGSRLSPLAQVVSVQFASRPQAVGVPWHGFRPLPHYLKSYAEQATCFR
jgi:hypothetical protein